MKDPLLAGHWPSGMSNVTIWNEAGQLMYQEWNEITRTRQPEEQYWKYGGIGLRGWTRFQWSIDLTVDQPPR